MATMPHGVEITWVEFLLRQLSSGALKQQFYCMEASPASARRRG